MTHALGRLFRAEHVEADDEGDLQTVTLYGQHGETLKKVHRIQPFGFHSNIPQASHGLGMQFGYGGRTLKAFIGGEDPRYRPRKREVGSSAIYDANGSIVSLVEKEIRFVHAKQHTHVVGDCTLTLTKDGFAFQGGRITHNGRNIGADHKHGGVQPGGGDTAGPER